MAESTIPRRGDNETWHQSLTRAVRNSAELLRRLQLPDDAADLAASAEFPLLVPESYLQKMRVGDRADPLLLQVLPQAREHENVPGFVRDAVDDTAARRAPGLLQKYSGRALMILTGACAVHCRYCFRRHYPYNAEPRRLEDWNPAFEAIAADPSLDEILLSGGDPLLIPDARLREILERLAAIPHLRRVRIHTRLPIVLPNRVTGELTRLITATRLTPIVVVHANHPHEIVDDCEAALRQLVRAGLTTLNQAVLLRGVNDSVDTQRELCLRLINVGVIPYYLHQLDRVAGTAHFEVPEQTGLNIIAALQAVLPGYAVPRYVRETAGAPSKLPIV